MVGVALNVTDVPEQMLFADAIMSIPGVTEAETTILITLDVTDDEVAQRAVEVITQLTRSPFCKELVVYVGLLPPTLDPFTTH